MSLTPETYARVKAEVLALFGWSDANLSPAQTLRLDCAVAARLALDDLQGKIMRGEAVDPAKMLPLSETLSRLLPPAALAAPPPEAERVDPRERLLATYKEARARAGISEWGTVVDSLRATAITLAEENEQLRAVLAEPTMVGAALMPLPDNVRQLSPRAPQNAPAATPAPPAAQPPQTWDDTPNGRAWNEWRNAGGYSGVPGSIGDRWSPPRDW